MQSFTVRVKIKAVKREGGKVTQSLKKGPIFEVEASTRANAQPLIKDALQKRGYTEYSIVPVANEATYIVYVTG